MSKKILILMLDFCFFSINSTKKIKGAKRHNHFHFSVLVPDAPINNNRNNNVRSLISDLELREKAIKAKLVNFENSNTAFYNLIENKDLFKVVYSKKLDQYTQSLENKNSFMTSMNEFIRANRQNLNAEFIEFNVLIECFSKYQALYTIIDNLSNLLNELNELYDACLVQHSEARINFV